MNKTYLERTLKHSITEEMFKVKQTNTLFTHYVMHHQHGRKPRDCNSLNLPSCFLTHDYFEVVWIVYSVGQVDKCQRQPYLLFLTPGTI